MSKTKEEYAEQVKNGTFRGFKPDPPEMAPMPYVEPQKFLGKRDADGTARLYLTSGDSEDVIEISPDRSQKVYNHSPTGFNWGYGGSGPSQLALAMLLVATDDEQVALRHYQDFKWAFVAGMSDTWTMPVETVNRWLASKRFD